MADLIWLNGSVMPLSEARIGVEDRGFQFADGVYEVVRFYNGRCFTLTEHLDRLDRSAANLRIVVPLPRFALADAINSLVSQSGLADGMIYLQLTRGQAPRLHPFPKNTVPTLLFHTRKLSPVSTPDNVRGAKIITVNDERWQRCFIKSIALLPNILAKQQAIEAGADEGVFLHQGHLTECCSSNFFIVSKGQVITHPVGEKVLPGITRLVLQKLAGQLDIPFIERPVTIEEAHSADDVFITSTTREIGWVSHWDGRTIATAPPAPGSVVRRLHDAYQTLVASECELCQSA